MKASTALIILFLVAASFFFFSDNEADPDIWGHLKFGQDIYETHRIPRYDPYSYTFYGSRWIDHEWLSELIFFAVFKFAKDTGLILFKVVIGFIMTVLLYLSISGRTKSIFLRLLFLTLCLSVISYGFVTRPQVFTYLFFTIFIIFIDRFEESRNQRWLYGFPIIMIAWCNLHGGFVAGLGALFLYFLYKAIRHEITKGLTIITVFSAAATLITPYGIDMWAFLYKAIPLARPNIFEWQKVSFTILYLDYFLVLFISAVGALFAKKRNLFEMAALIIAFLFSFNHTRHIVLFAILAAVFIPKYIDSFAKERLFRAEEGIPRQFLFGLLIVISVYFISMAPHRSFGNPLRMTIREDRYPMDAIKFMNDNEITGNIFTNFNWAQLCIRELPEGSRVFFDGRYETVYDKDFIRDYFDILYGKKEYKEYLKGFTETDMMLLHSDNPLSIKLLNDKGWVPVYSSSIVYLFVKENARNRMIIERFKKGRLIYDRTKFPSYYLRD